MHETGLKNRGKRQIADYILDKLYSLESRKDDICFLMLVVVVSYFGWQMLKAWIF